MARVEGVEPPQHGFGDRLVAVTVTLMSKSKWRKVEELNPRACYRNLRLAGECITTLPTFRKLDRRSGVEPDYHALQASG